MNILFLSTGRFESIEDSGIYTDLLRKFRNEGHNVYIMSAREKRHNKPTEYLKEDGVHHLRVKIGNLTKTNIVEKGISTIRIENQFLSAIKKYLTEVRFDLIIYSTPPITFEKVIRYVKNRDNAISYLLLKDIFPQNAVDLDMFNKSSLIYKYFRKKEKKLYNQSDYIGCMSEANVDFILEHNSEISPSIVEVCPNSIDPLDIDRSQIEVTKIREKYNIPQDKTIFIYGGNLGKPQGIDFLIDCLNSNRANNNIHFVIVGSGTEFNKLKHYLEKEKTPNVQLFDQIAKADYDLLVNSCDVGLIFLDKRFTIPNFPSRILSYMQASMPILAATDVNSDIGETIERGKFGYWCESSNSDDFNAKLQMLCNKELRLLMGKNARDYLESNYTSRHSYNIIMQHFK